MDCYYINLASETEKRAQLEKNFAQHNTLNWPLHRFEALDRSYVRTHQVKGSLTDSEKGCFLSHQQVINLNTHGTDHVFIMEDDIVFSGKTLSLIQRITGLEQLDWDILYTDVCVPDISFMLHLFHLKNECVANDQLQIVDLEKHNFASAAAYIINKKSIQKIANFLGSFDELNMPIDIVYRSLIQAGHLKGYVAFPFLTSLSSLSEDSRVQPKQHAYTEVVWHSFRKLMWMDGSINAIDQNLEILKKGRMSDEANALALIFSGFLSSDFISK